jgi:hypothetical protein
VSVTITPSKPGYTFDPPSVTTTVSRNVNQDFVAAAIPYTITGTVSGGATEVTISLSGDASAVTTTLAGGDYSLTVPVGSYTVTPSKTGYTFDPPSRAVTVDATNGDVAAQDFAAVASTIFTISGVITGPVAVPAAITVTLGGGATRTVTTDMSGTYSFTALANESYTVTPSFPARSGYVFTPASATVNMAGASKVQDFQFVSEVPSYRITGTVAYAGAKTGRVILNAYDTSCSNCPAVAGTSVDGPGPYVLQGIRSGSFVVRARMDSGGHGARNAGDPAGATGTVTVATVDATGFDLTLTDPAAPTAAVPTGLAAAPGEGATVLSWDATYDGSGNETATSYDISWGPDAAATTGGVITVAARDDAHYVHSELTPGTTYYYKVRANVAGSASAYSTVVSATAGAITGTGSSVSGTVSLDGTAAGPLTVLIIDDVNKLLWVQRFATPTFPQAYTISGVPAGQYFVGAFVDSNANGVIDEGDVSNLKGGADGPSLTVAGVDVVAADLTLSTAASSIRTMTEHALSATSSQSYMLGHDVSNGVRRVVRATIVYGPGIPLPLSVPNERGSWQTWNALGATSPAVGDLYKFYVYYDDGTSETLLTSSVTGVLDSFAQTLSETTNGGGSRTAPIFGWVAPSNPPTGTYGYQVGVTGPDASWWYPDGPPLPSTTTPLSVRYNADGKATPAALVSGTSYTWSVTVIDANGNRARRERTYTPR